MKTTLLLFAASSLVSPLVAQQPHQPGTDLIDLFEKSQREGATDEQLRQMLENKALLQLEIPELRELTPEQRQLAEDDIRDLHRHMMRKGEAKQPGRAKESASPGEMVEEKSPQTPPRWLVGLVVKPLVPALRSHFDLPEGAGMVVDGVMSEGPAAKAGIKDNDIVVSANGRNISSLEDLKAVVEKAGSEGKPVQLEVIHRGKRDKVTLEPVDSAPPSEGRDKPERNPSPEFMRRMNRLFEMQQKEIDRLYGQVEELRKQVEKLEKRDGR